MQRVDKTAGYASRAYALLCEVIDHMPIVMLARGAWSAWSERHVDTARFALSQRHRYRPPTL